MSDRVSELMPLVYDELRRIAAAYVRGERPGQTIQATALVNEAFVRLAGERARHFNGRTHFLAIAALSMRQILVQRARARNAIKRGGGPVDEGAELLNEGGLDRVFERLLLCRDRRAKQQGKGEREREGQPASPCRCGHPPGLRHQNFQLAPSITLRGISRRVIGLPVSGC